MVEITDAVMEQKLATVRTYCTVLLRKGPAYEPPDVRSAAQAKIIHEHGRRNMQANAEGIMPIVGPLRTSGDLVGLAIFNVPEAEVRAFMDADIAVQAGVLAYEIATFFGFPGASLPQD